jgi:hypothetical protein
MVVPRQVDDGIWKSLEKIPVQPGFDLGPGSGIFRNPSPRLFQLGIEGTRSFLAASIVKQQCGFTIAID